MSRHRSERDPLAQRPGESDEDHIERLNAIDTADRARDRASERAFYTDPKQIAEDLAQADSFDDLKAILMRIVDRMILTEEGGVP